MAINLRKLLHEQVHNQNITCSDCDPACPYECSYPEFTWPPQPSPHPPQTTNPNISPYFIIIVALLASAFLFITYYLIMVRCSTRFRSPPASQTQELSDEEHGIEVDNPIWYITTIGLQPSVINSISVIKYEKHDKLIDVTNCSVCLNEFQDKETLRLLPKCNHAFHIPCIDTWLSSHTNCPLCRSVILSNTLSAILSPGDRTFSQRTGSNQHAQILSLDSDGDLTGNRVLESDIRDENEDSKTEYESVTTERRSISVDSVAVAEIAVGEFEESSVDSTSVIISSLDGRD